MPWTCPACSLAIRHNEAEPTPRPGVVYRCHICRLELALDPDTGKLAMTAMPQEDVVKPSASRKSAELIDASTQLGERATAAQNAAMVRNERAKELTAKANRTRSRKNVVTKYPDVPPPLLSCPRCDARLTYVDTVLSGVKSDERYDRFVCSSHGPFEYRHRTRRLRAVENH